MPTPYYPSVATLVRIRIAQTNYDSEHLIDVLVEATKPLLDARGHRQSAWGRLKSDHGAYLLCSYWDDLDAADAFKSSPSAQALAHTLAGLTNPTHSSNAGAMVHQDDVHVPTISTIDFTGGRLDPQAVLGPHTQIRHVYFPAPVPDATRAAVRRLPGLVYRFGMGISGQKPPPGGREWLAYHRDPAVGWFVGEDKLFGSDDDGKGAAGTKTDANTKMTRWWGGRECDEFVCIVFWKDEERQRRFLKEETIPVTVPGDEPETDIWVRDMSLAEQWEGKLREAGAVGWEDEFVDFCVV